MINLNIPQLFVHFGVLFWCFHKNALAQPQKMQLRIKVATKKHHYSAVLRWPPVCRARGGARRSISSRGSSGHQWPERFVRSRRSQRSAQVEGIRARACRDPSRPLGVDASPVRPPDASDSTGLTASARPLATSRAAARTMQRFGRNAWSCGVVPRKFCFDAAQFVTNASVLCFAQNLASQRY